MKIISWNARGMNSHSKQRLLKRQMEKNHPDMLFLQETKCNKILTEKLRLKLGRNFEVLEIESKGREGGLATFWDTRKYQLVAAEASKNYLAMEMLIIGNSFSFLCINIYGPQRLDDKLVFLDSLKNLIARHPQANLILGGDFNMITSLMEKKGGLRKLNRDGEYFKEFIDKANFIDVYPKQGSFTWNNRRGGENLISSRLDRFLVSENLLLEGRNLESNILPSGGSDHWPISLVIEVPGSTRNKPFRFEKFWLEHPNFLTLVGKWWAEPLEEEGSKMFNLQKRLRNVKLKLKEWNHTVFGNIFKEKANIEQKLEQIHKDGIAGRGDEQSREQEKVLTQQWHTRCQQEETFWKQKSRVLWLKEGEQNTKFFHRSAIDYRNANRILELKNHEGDILRNHDDISGLLTNHFSNIAQEPNVNREAAIQEITSAIPRLITDEQNWSLRKRITMEEVEEAVKSMPNDKAPGPDGFTINFYKACWDIVKNDIWEIVEDSRRSKTILKSLNSTFIALVPKVEEANTPDKFRPIALCNVIYKIISKIIANRLKRILPGIISLEQSGYVEGRQILDNILLAQEMIHSLHARKVPGMLMQLDLSKAYDKVSWTYLEAILKAFGFNQPWIRWVSELIKSTSYSILVNGTPSTPFRPTRGIRQGDPLSPFLFVILMEGLSRLIIKKKDEGQIRGLQPIRSCPATTHQQFVDDTMLHGTPTVKEANAYKDILHLFSRASGMEINFSKSTIFFFNTHPAVQSHLSRLLGFKIGSLPSRYLGAPLTLKPWQKVHWEKILANMERRCKHWTNRALNLAGRLVLTKAILQAIPQYMLSILPAPKGILDQMRSIQSTFLWGGNKEKRKWSLVAWKKLCRPKNRGGLNLVDPLITNRVCGAKIWWKWISSNNLPWATHWKEKYKPTSSILDLIRMQDTPNGSPIWNHAQGNRSIIQNHCFWEIRNGTQALFWEDAWQQTPKLESPILTPLLHAHQSEGHNRVNHYWNPVSEDPDWREWKIFDPDQYGIPQQIIHDLNQQLQKRKIRIAAENDKLRWGPKGNGEFTLKEARSIIEQVEHPDIIPWADKVWDNLLWPKIRTFLWLMMQKRTLTWENLRKKGFQGPSKCHMCQQEEETMNHLFNSCDWASQLWLWLEAILEDTDRNRESIQESIINWRKNFSQMGSVNSIWKCSPGFVTWTIWKERNRRIFTQETRSIEHAKDSILINIKQLVQTKCKIDPTDKPTGNDLRILKAFHLEAFSSCPSGGPHALSSAPVHQWQPPPEACLKMNFDGASRGNPGTAGIGGVIRNHKGDIVHIFCRSLGECTNNEAEFAAMEQGLKILKSRRQGNFIVEGDSAVAILAAKRLQAGTQLSKVTKHWRLAKATESIADLIKDLKGTVFQSIRRKANGVADFLANHGADTPHLITNTCWQNVNCPTLKVSCEQLAAKDILHVDSS